MPAYDENVYVHPEKYGLEIVACVDAYEPDYSFDLFLILREKATGKLFVASDSGCSCPMPFEDHDFPQDFTEVKTWEDVKREYNAHFPENDYGWRNRASIQEARSRVVGAIRSGT